MSQETTDIQPAARLARLIELSRGIHHGIAFGDAADQLTRGEPVRRAGVATQLSLATTEGLIRTMERAGQKLSFDWGHENLQALRRWGIAQAIPGVTPQRGNAPSLLAAVPAYGERRGSAPATVRALRGGPSAVTAAGHSSLGAHALVRTLPYAVLVALHGPSLTEPIADLVRTTHGHALSEPTARAGVLLAARAAARAVSLPGAWSRVLDACLPGDNVLKPRLTAAHLAALTAPGDPDELKRIAPDRTAVSVLAAAVYVVLSHPTTDELTPALVLASYAPDRKSTSALVGGMLGARWGSTPMLRMGGARHELAWACDALATDLAMTAMLSPLGKEPDGEAWLPSWGMRYSV